MAGLGEALWTLWSAGRRPDAARALDMANRACRGAARALEMAVRACPGTARALEMTARACPGAARAFEMDASTCPGAAKAACAAQARRLRSEWHSKLLFEETDRVHETLIHYHLIRIGRALICAGSHQYI